MKVADRVMVSFANLSTKTKTIFIKRRTGITYIPFFYAFQIIFINLIVISIITNNDILIIIQN